MKVRFILGSTLLSFSLLLAGCGSSDVSTGGSGNSTEKKSEDNAEAKKEEANVKSVDASAQKTEALGLKVGLGEVKVAEDKVSIGTHLENTASDVLNFYPDQGQLVVGDMQLDANMFMTSGEIGGDVQPGVKQEGVIEFLAPEGKKIDVKSVTELKIIFGDVTTADFMQNKPVEFVVPVK